MTIPTQAPAPCRGLGRLVRTTVPATAAVLVAVGAHLAGGGAVPSPVLLVALTGGAAALAHRLSAHRWTPRTLLALLLGLQSVVHLACAAGHGPAPAGPGMLIWHVVATLVTGAALLHGEAVVWSLLDVLALRRARRVLSAGCAVVASRPTRPVTTTWAPPRGRRVVRGLLRGPPAVA